MKLIKNQILDVLEILEQKYGGYTGQHISEIAAKKKITPKGLRKRINKWKNEDSRFTNRQKRVLRIVERSVIRAHEPNVSLYLKSSELILLSIAVWKLNWAIRRLQEL